MTAVSCNSQRHRCELALAFEWKAGQQAITECMQTQQTHMVHTSVISGVIRANQIRIEFQGGKSGSNVKLAHLKEIDGIAEQ